MWKVQGLVVNGSKQLCWSPSNVGRECSSLSSFISTPKQRQSKHCNFNNNNNSYSCISSFSTSTTHCQCQRPQSEIKIKIENNCDSNSTTTATANNPTQFRKLFVNKNNSNNYYYCVNQTSQRHFHSYSAVFGQFRFRKSSVFLRSRTETGTGTGTGCVINCNNNNRHIETGPGISGIFGSNLIDSKNKGNSINIPNLSDRRGLTTAFPIPGTSAAAAAQGLVKGTVVDRQIWIENEIFRRQELRSRAFGGREPAVVTMGTAVGLSQGISTGSPGRNRISSEEITRVAEDFLGTERFSSRLTLSDNFAQFQQIICLFLFKVARFDHPLLYITNIIEQESLHNSGKTDAKNPYPWWRSMMILLTAEMYGFPRDIEAAPPEVHWAIRDKQNRLGKICEVSWITHQLHRRVLDISSISTRLPSLYPSSFPMSPKEQLELLENLHKANKAITLVGDLLLTQKCAHLAALKSPIALELICNSLADFCESEFELGIKSLNRQHFNYENWLSRSELGLGSLLGHCMYSALLFSGFNAENRKRAFQLGSLLGVFYQAYDDLSFFNRTELQNPTWLDVGILPVVYHVERNPDILLKSHPEIFNAVKSCRSTMDQSLETFQFLKEHALKALASYDYVENTTARDILINFIHSLTPESGSV